MLNEKNLIERYWHLGCLDSDLSREGDYLLIDIGSQQVVLYHDGTEVIAFDNLCPHRGTKFFRERRGNKLAVCGYHGWSYSRGHIKIHSIENFTGDVKGLRLRTYNVDYCGRFIFFAINPKCSLVDQLSDNLYTVIESISFDLDVLCDFDHYQYKCNWVIAVENALEPTHVPFVHRSTLGAYNLSNMRNEFFAKNNSIVKFDIANNRISRSLQSLDKYFELSPYAYSGYMSIYLYPFGFISSTHGHSYSVQLFTPGSPESTWFYSGLYSVKTKGESGNEISNSIISAAIKANRQIFEEDHNICKNVSYDFWLRNSDRNLYHDEIKIKVFRQSVLDE